MSKCRRLVPFGVELANRFCDSSSARDKHRRIAFRDLHQIYAIMYEGGEFLSDEEINRLRSSIDSFLAHQNWLQDEAASGGIPEYNVTIKSHYLWHLGQDAYFYNPAMGWTYQDEDFMGRIATLGRSVTNSTTDVQRPRFILRKYMTAINTRWQALA